MRTTLNISDATLAALRERSKRTNRPLNRVVDEALKAGLAAGESAVEPVRIDTFDVGVKPAYRGMSKNQLYDQIEAEDLGKVAES